jgi:hypothetical protein
MRENKHHPVLESLRARWQKQALLLRLLQAAVVSAPLSAVAARFGGLSPWWGFACWAVCFTLWAWYTQKWVPDNTEVARYLDRSVPELEESATLLLASGHSGLAVLQAQRTGAILETLRFFPKPYKQAFRRAFCWLGASLLVSLLLLFLPRKEQTGPTNRGDHGTVFSGADKPEAAADMTPSLTIVPPAYTGKPARSQSDWDLRAEQGATLRWKIRSSRRVGLLYLTFSDTTRLTLKPADSTHTLWEGKKIIQHPGFYQVHEMNGAPTSIDNRETAISSLFHKMDMIPDLAPVIRIPAPGPYTVIDFGEPQKVSLRVQLSDDYGIGEAALHLTTASGSGEAVRFRDLTRPFHTSFSPHLAAYDLRETIDLQALGLHPGDDLYFYVSATDTRRQESHSDRFIVTLPDTAQLMSLEGLASTVNVKPEFFRSERQIIIEAEALLKDQPSLTLPAFRQKSLDLGDDQKLLHLRYGQFLGEEAESDMEKAPQPGTTSDIVSAAQDFGNADKLIDAFTDKHDNSEDATFFDPATKEKLKATLSEMWKAEVQLRTYQPRAALPFAYKALRLLKELQQQSRAYVAKTGVKVPPLKPEKRLTGDLGSVIAPLNRESRAIPPDDEERKAIGVLEQLSAGENPLPGSLNLLEPAQALLIREAASAPSLYLPSLEAMGRIRIQAGTGKQVRAKDIDLVERALHRLLPLPVFRPGGGSRAGYKTLSEGYFNRLNPAPL